MIVITFFVRTQVDRVEAPPLPSLPLPAPPPSCPPGGNFLLPILLCTISTSYYHSPDQEICVFENDYNENNPSPSGSMGSPPSCPPTPPSPACSTPPPPPPIELQVTFVSSKPSTNLMLFTRKLIIHSFGLTKDLLITTGDRDRKRA